MIHRIAVLVAVLAFLAVFVLSQVEDAPPEVPDPVVEAATPATSTTVPPPPETTTTVPPPTTTTVPEPPKPPPPPPPPAKPAPVPLTGDCYGLRDTLTAVGLPELFCEVVRCESGGRPWITNGSSTGLTQLHRRWHEDRAARLGFTWDRMFEVVPNLTVAADLYHEQGLTPWNPSRYCWGRFA